MSPDSIRDGTGRGFLAQVNSDNLLEVNAVVEQEYAFIARKKGGSFVVSTGVITADGVANDIFILTNPTSTKFVVIHQLDISPTKVATTIIKLGQTYVSGGTPIEPTNLNGTSSRTSVVQKANVQYGNNLSLSGTGAVYVDFIASANTPFREEIQDAIILGAGDSISVNVEAAAGALIYVSVKFFERDADV